jgi:hypothetical protein
MEHLHEPEIDPLDIDKPGYYSPWVEEAFAGFEYEELVEGKWIPKKCVGGELALYTHDGGSIRVKYLQAKDIMELGFGRSAPNLPMYQRGSYTITAYRLLDPTYSRIKISQNGIIVFEGHVKNKSELRRILILNEINFADN